MLNVTAIVRSATKRICVLVQVLALVLRLRRAQRYHGSSSSSGMDSDDCYGSDTTVRRIGPHLHSKATRYSAALSAEVFKHAASSMFIHFPTDSGLRGRLGTIPGFPVWRFAHSRLVRPLQHTGQPSQSHVLYTTAKSCSSAYTLALRTHHAIDVKSRRCSSHSPRDRHLSLTLFLTRNAMPEDRGWILNFPRSCD